VPLTLSQLAAQTGSSVNQLIALAEEVESGEHYKVRTIRVGRHTRSICKPDILYDTTLKEVRRAIERSSKYRPPAHVFGFVKRRSTMHNASRHLGAECVLTLDLKDYFGSISRSVARDALVRAGITSEAAGIVAVLGAPRENLAIGLSTSPYLSNLAFEDTDHDLVTLAEARGLTFSRYVDDLSFSGQVDDADADAIRLTLGQRGWSINESKTRFMRQGRSQYVTGLSITDSVRPHAPRTLKNRMRWRLHIIERHSYDVYLTEFGGDARGHHPRHLMGLARYIANLEPSLGHQWLARWEDALSTEWSELEDIAMTD